MKKLLCCLMLYIGGEMSGDEFSGLVSRSGAFASFPTHDNRIAVIAGSDLKKQAKIVEQAQNTYPIYHKKILTLIDSFLEYKLNFGSCVEQKLYLGMTREAFITRLLKKRPLMFMGSNDQYLLRDGITTGCGGFETIGTENEVAPLVLEEYLSYDEMQIAALIGVSVPTYFINDGNRYNRGVQSQEGTYEPEGVYVGLVGARFEKPGLIEWQHMIVTKEQNTKKHGYGHDSKERLAIWSKLYGHTFATYDEANYDTSGRFIPIKSGGYFDSAIYKERLRLVIEPFLQDAHKRGLEMDRKVYVHTVGLGLGVWKIIPEQAKLMLEVYAQVIKTHNLSQITDINFSHFTPDSIAGIKNGEFFEPDKNSIKIHFSKRNPADKLQGVDEGKLLVAGFAWDGNSFAGNEYWIGALDASGDPSAACCSTIAELQNPEINLFLSR